MCIVVCVCTLMYRNFIFGSLNFFYFPGDGFFRSYHSGPVLSFLSLIHRALLQRGHFGFAWSLPVWAITFRAYNWDALRVFQRAIRYPGMPAPLTGALHNRDILYTVFLFFFVHHDSIYAPILYSGM